MFAGKQLYGGGGIARVGQLLTGGEAGGELAEERGGAWRGKG